jgi:hypothetical protein
MRSHLNILVVVAAAALLGCGARDAQTRATGPDGTEAAPWPPITFPATTAAEPIHADDVTLAMSAESGFRPWQIVRQNIEFASHLAPGVALRNNAGVLLRAFITPRDGSEQFRPGFSPVGEQAWQTAKVPVSDSAYIELALDGDVGMVQAAIKSLDLEALGASGVGDLESLSKSFGGDWVEVARVDQETPNPFGESWSVSYTDGNDVYLEAVAYAAADQPISIERASLVFVEELIKVGETEVLYRQGGAGATPSVVFSHPSGYLVRVWFDEKNRERLEVWFDDFIVRPVSELQASLVTP